MTRPGDVCAARRLRRQRRRGAFRPACDIVGGTTDSIAAFVACATDIDKGALNVAAGDAVTSLGSTTARSSSCRTSRVDDSSVGVYSHRLEDNWLVGGASNAGCRVLREFSCVHERRIGRRCRRVSTRGRRTTRASTRSSAPGERFPYNDPGKSPCCPRRDGDRARVLADLLTGIADVERLVPFSLKAGRVASQGSLRRQAGGARNPQWAAMRSNLLGVDVVRAANSDAAFGAAVLNLAPRLGGQFGRTTRRCTCN